MSTDKSDAQAKFVVSSAVSRAHEAIDTGGYPDFIDRGRRGKIEQGTHPYADNPAWPKEPGEGSWPGGDDNHVKAGGKIKSYADLVASDQYSTIAKRLARYLGHNPSQQELMRLMMGMMGSVEQAVGIEQGHEEELQQAAIELVLSLPEFEQAREAYEAGELRIVATLRPEIDVSQTPLDAPEPDEEQQSQLNVDQIAKELKAEQFKRRMVNLMMQGAAVNKNFAFQLADEKLNEINPELMKLYGIIMATGEIAYWILPEEMQRAMMGSGQGAAGKAGLKFEDGVAVIYAEAMLFPVLVQEIVKGMMEYIAYDPDEDAETRHFTQQQTDTLGNEPWDIKFGPAVWRQILRMVGNDDQRWTPQVYQHLIQLSPDEFSQTFQEILKGSPTGRKFIQDLLAQVKAEAAGGEESDSYGESQTRGLLRRFKKD